MVSPTSKLNCLYYLTLLGLVSVHFSSVSQLCPILCGPMDHMESSVPGFPVCHQLPELTQTHVHRVSDAIQLSHPRSSILFYSNTQ